MPQEIAKHLYRIEVPLPRDPLGSINSYVITSKEKNLVIDTGQNLEACSSVLEKGLKDLNVDLEKTDFNLRKRVEDVSDVVIQRISEKNLELNLLIKNDVPKYVAGDPVRLRQILLNLVVNAIKFTERGEITITVSCKSSNGTDQQSVELLFSVKDTGIGIRKDRLEGIFENFTQADSSITRKFGIIYQSIRL